MKNKVFKLSLQVPASLVCLMVIVVATKFTKDVGEVFQSCRSVQQSECKSNNVKGSVRSCQGTTTKGR